MDNIIVITCLRRGSYSNRFKYLENGGANYECQKCHGEKYRLEIYRNYKLETIFEIIN